jgi:hypothetical protein
MVYFPSEDEEEDFGGCALIDREDLYGSRRFLWRNGFLPDGRIVRIPPDWQDW